MRFLTVRRMPILRASAAMAIVAAIALFAAAVIRAGGFGGWLLALVACVICPFVVALVAGRWHVLFGLLASGAVVASFPIRDYWLDRSGRGYGLGWNPALAAIAVAVCLSLPSSLAAAAIAHSSQVSKQNEE